MIIECYATSGTTSILSPHNLTKTWPKNKRPPPSLKFFRFPEEKTLYVIHNLDNYLIKQNAWGTKETQALVSFITPGKAVSSLTVSWWLKQALEIAGINREISKRHSTCVALSTKAEISGVSVSVTLKQDHWFNVSTFQKFYRKCIMNSSANF